MGYARPVTVELHGLRSGSLSGFAEDRVLLGSVDGVVLVSALSALVKQGGGLAADASTYLGGGPASKALVTYLINNVDALIRDSAGSHMGKWWSVLSKYVPPSGGDATPPGGTAAPGGGGVAPLNFEIPDILKVPEPPPLPWGGTTPGQGYQATGGSAGTKPSVSSTLAKNSSTITVVGLVAVAGLGGLLWWKRRQRRGGVPAPASRAAMIEQKAVLAGLGRMRQRLRRRSRRSRR